MGISRASGTAGDLAVRRSNAVVVGHDASKGADLALTTALGLASQLSAPVVIARTWSLATAPSARLGHRLPAVIR